MAFFECLVYSKDVKTQTSDVEKLVARVRARRVEQGLTSQVQSNWREAYGTVKDDALFREAARLGEQWRNKENERG